MKSLLLIAAAFLTSATSAFAGEVVCVLHTTTFISDGYEKLESQPLIVKDSLEYSQGGFDLEMSISGSTLSVYLGRNDGESSRSEVQIPGTAGPLFTLSFGLASSASLTCVQQ